MVTKKRRLLWAIVALTLLLSLFGAIGYATSSAPSDGSAAYVSTTSQEKPGPSPNISKGPEPRPRPQPQFCWRSCCSPVEQVTVWRVVAEGTACLWTWSCLGPGLFYYRVEEAVFRCIKGWRCFGFCVSRDSNYTYWTRSRTIRYLIGCGCMP